MAIRVFQQSEIHDARAFAAQSDDNVAVHLHRMLIPTAPACFVRDIRAGKPIAHVFCRNVTLLQQLARRLGVRIVKIDRPATASQHVDLCGRPLEKLLAELEATP